MPTTQQKLSESVNRLSRYFGLYTARDLSGRIAMEQLQGISGLASNATFSIPVPSIEVTELVASVIDTTEGSFTVKDLIQRLNQNMTQTDEETSGSATVIERFNKFIEIVSPVSPGITGAPAESDDPDSPTTDMKNVYTSDFVNLDRSNANKDSSPHLSVIKINNVRVTPAAKNANAVTIFLNGIPSVEMSRAVPYLDVRLILPGSPISANQTLQNLSLFRFLEGNVRIDDNPSSNRSIMALANKVISTDSLYGVDATPENTTFTQTGMEIFTSPQTLVNGDEENNPNRVNPILDKFQPLMTIKDFLVEIRPSTGLMCFKTATLNFTLHDRSRLAEITDLIRPDLYARTELLIEYGWIHPESNSTTSSVTNPYAELIGAMRAREKYGIINSSLTFDDAGQVNVTLSLAMRGGSDVSSEVISTDENGGVNNILGRIREISEAIGAYRRRIFGREQGPSSVEVRGIQILDAAEDARSNLILNEELRNNLRTFQRTLAQRGRGPNAADPTAAARNLSESLSSLYSSAAPENGTTSRRGSGSTNGGGLVGSLRRTVQQNIITKMARLASGKDPFKKRDALTGHPHRAALENGTGGAQRRDSRGRADPRSAAEIDTELGDVPNTVSLAKLLLLFIGEPLAMTRKFDDIQFVYYPFNSGAGYARNLNIGSFEVDTRYFYENYKRLRLESLSRSANINLRDFMNFVATTLIDDHAARSYGLFVPGGLFRRVSVDGGGSTTQATEDAVQLQSRIETILANVTPDASFRMPQIDFYIEALPQRIQVEGEENQSGDGKTILRIHVFDKQMTSYETQGALIAASREEEINNITSIPHIEGGDVGVVESQVAEYNAVKQAAVDAGFLEQIGETQVFRIRGGTNVLKEFIRRTMPYVIYGSSGTTIKQSTLSSNQDPALSTVNMLRSFQSNGAEPNGESPGGLPVQIIPCVLTMTTYGCPLVDYAQQFFIDFQTGTSVDNIYAVTGLTHKISPGEFSSELKMAPLDAFGRYRPLLDRINQAAQALSEGTTAEGESPATTVGT